jgi:Anti-anti-sigma regulatory factor (antagonist of anti-sigma factor)
MNPAPAFPSFPARPATGRGHGWSARPAPRWRSPEVDLSITPLPDEDGVQLSGMLDATTHEALRSALHALLARRRTWHLRLAGLEFVDVAGATELVRLARDRRIVLHDPPPSLRRILALCFTDVALDLRP